MKISKRYIVIGALLVVVFAFVTTWALASGGDDNIITACVAKGSGNVRIIEEGQSCRPSEDPVEWRGMGIVYITNYQQPIPHREPCPYEGCWVLIAECPAGYVGTGGGYKVYADGAVVIASGPSEGAAGWRARVDETTTAGTDLTVYAVCVPGFIAPAPAGNTE